MKRLILLIIVLFSFLLRVYRTDTIPPALSWDEVSIGYNAYSILKTGRDEHGRFIPLDTFIAYGDYKPPLPMYITVPFVAIFGLNELSVRLPSVLFGTLTVLATFFLVKELFKKSKNYELITNNLPLLSTALLAISPWHINLSRAGFEATIALFFIVLGVYLVLRSQIKPKLWIICWLPFVAAIYTFNSSRYFTPILSIALTAYVYTEIKQHIRVFAAGIIAALIIIVPIFPHLISQESRLRFKEVNIFTDESIVKIANDRIARGKHSFIAKIVNNRRIGYVRSYLLHFFDNLQPDFLFIKGDGNPKFSIQDVGQLYLIEAPFLVIGVFSLFLLYPNIAYLLLFWMLAAMIPAATARETPHALRILNSLPTWQIFVAFGILHVASRIRRQASSIKGQWVNRYVRSLLNIFLLLLYGFSIVYYLHNYYRHYAKEFSREWQYGYREAIRYAQILGDRYDKMIVTESIGRPYMYALFYSYTDPSELFRTKKSYVDEAGFYHVDSFGKYEFPKIIAGPMQPNTLYIWEPGFLPPNARTIKTIQLLNGEPVLVIFDDGNTKI